MILTGFSCPDADAARAAHDWKGRQSLVVEAVW